MVALVGKNGAGKSTLASLICGFMQPDQGEIYLNGDNLAGYSIKERGEKIGLVMQSPNQMISKPMIYDEVALGLRVREVAEEKIKERVFETLKICGLYPFRNWPVSALSFGQKKRVTIASILVMNPEVLILDEPTAGQDFRHYTEIMEFLRRIHEKLGITIIMITHDMHLMLEYTDRAIVIADGKMLADDTPAHILTNEEISDRAYLKKTSLYDLAVKCDIAEPTAFVERFIQYERRWEEMSRLLTYDPKDTWIHRLSGLTKLVFFLMWSIVSMITYDTRVLLFMLVSSLIIFRVSKIEWKQISTVFKFILFFLCLNLLAIFLFSPYEGVKIYGAQHDLLHIAGNYTITTEQLFYEFNIMIKYFTVIPAVLMFILTTNPSEFAASMNKIGVSYKISYSIAIALRYIRTCRRILQRLSMRRRHAESR